MAQNENDTRLGILNTLLTTPHRRLDLVYPIHAEMVKQDPLFYVRLAAWYTDTGEIRDHKECFIINLCLSDFPGHRDAGLAMLRELPPYQVCRVIDFIRGTKVSVRKSVAAREPAAAATGRTTKMKVGEDREEIEIGLKKQWPNSVRTEVTRYLRERESESAWFDSTVLVARKFVKRLYKRLRIVPGNRAQAILFDNEPPSDSKLFALKELAKAKTPADQAKVIIEQKIPYKVATTVVSAMTPTVLLALIEVMSDQEILISLGNLKRRGAFDNPELKAAIDAKLEKAKKGKRVSALKGLVAAKVSGVDEATVKQLQDIGDAQVKARGRIKKATALLIDSSGSMTQAIEVGKRIGAMIAAIAESQFFAFAHDTMPYPLDASGDTLGHWEKALRGVSAGGGTSCGCPLAAMMKKDQIVEQFVLVTDGGENSTPFYADELAKYAKKYNCDPNTIIVKIGSSSTKIETDLRRAGRTVDVWDFKAGGDDYSMPGLIPLLAGGGKLDTLLTIMDWPIPKRKAS